MPTIEQIREQIAPHDKMGMYKNKSEVKELPKILQENEVIENITSGMYKNGNGILIGTSLRVAFIDKGLIFGLKVEDFSYDKISSVQYETGMLFGKVTIHASG